jgi:hypothetical protein
MKPRFILLLLTTFTVLFITGVLYAIPVYSFKYFAIEIAAFFPPRYTLLQIHGGATFVMLLILGNLFNFHVSDKISSAKNRRTGIVLLACMLVLIITGYLLYYGNLNLRSISGISHTIIGILATLLLVYHSIKHSTLRKPKK